jgi:hypothetical protein
MIEMKKRKRFSKLIFMKLLNDTDNEEAFDNDIVDMDDTEQEMYNRLTFFFYFFLIYFFKSFLKKFDLEFKDEVIVSLKVTNKSEKPPQIREFKKYIRYNFNLSDLGNKKKKKKTNILIPRCLENENKETIIQNNEKKNKNQKKNELEENENEEIILLKKKNKYHQMKHFFHF